MLPRELPDGWSVAGLDFTEDEEGASFSLSLEKGAASVSFLTTNEGVGDPPGGERTSRHSHPELGELQVEHEEDGDFLSDWLEVENGYSALGGKGATDQDLDGLIAVLAVF